MLRAEPMGRDDVFERNVLFGWSERLQRIGPHRIRRAWRDRLVQPARALVDRQVLRRLLADDLRSREETLDALHEQAVQAIGWLFRHHALAVDRMSVAAGQGIERQPRKKNTAEAKPRNG